MRREDTRPTVDAIAPNCARDEFSAIAAVVLPEVHDTQTQRLSVVVAVIGVANVAIARRLCLGFNGCHAYTVAITRKGARIAAAWRRRRGRWRGWRWRG